MCLFYRGATFSATGCSLSGRGALDAEALPVLAPQSGVPFISLVGKWISLYLSDINQHLSSG